MGSQRYNPYRSQTAAQGVGPLGVRPDVIAGGGGGSMPMESLPGGSQRRRGLVSFNDGDVNPITGTRAGGGFQSGYGGGGGGMPQAAGGSGSAGGMPGQFGGYGGVSSDFMSDPRAGYANAMRDMGLDMDARQQAVLNHGPGGAAAVQDSLAKERQGRQEADRNRALQNVRGDRWNYEQGGNRLASMGLMQKILGNPDVIDQSVREGMISAATRSASGGAEAQRDRLRSATGGKGGAYLSGMQDIGRNQMMAGADAQHRAHIDQATMNRGAQLDAIGAERSWANSDQGIMGNMREEERNTLAADYTLPDMSGLIGMAGAGGWGAGGGGGSGGMQMAPGVGSAAFGNMPGYNNSGWMKGGYANEANRNGQAGPMGISVDRNVGGRAEGIYSDAQMSGRDGQTYNGSDWGDAQRAGITREEFDRGMRMGPNGVYMLPPQGGMGAPAPGGGLSPTMPSGSAGGASQMPQSYQQPAPQGVDPRQWQQFMQWQQTQARAA